MFKKILMMLTFGFIGIQFIPVERTNPVITQEIELDEATRAIFRRACYDCHSNETIWPWYGYLAPASWLVANDVNHGRSHVNFSEWDKYTVDEKRHIIEGIPVEIGDGAMPLPIYMPLHPEAKISEGDLKIIKIWVDLRKKELDKKVGIILNPTGER